MEDKDRPTQLGPKKRDDLGKTVGLMLKISSQYFRLESVLCLAVAFVC